MTKVYINNIAAFLPNEPVANDAMESVLGQVGERPSRVRRLILRSNKIKSRYYAIDPETGATTHSNAELTAAAIRGLGAQGCDLNKLELLVCGTTLPDQLLPNHALMVHGELKNPPCEVVGTAGICLAGTMSLKYGYMSILSGESQNAVATGSENISSLLRGGTFSDEIESRVKQLEERPVIAFEKDFLRWMLSDGAGAVWMSNKPNTSGISLQIDWIWQNSYANEIDSCMYAGAEKLVDGSLKGWREYLPQAWLADSLLTIKQDVKLLNEKIVEYAVTKSLKRLLAAGKFAAADIDWFLPHYSSDFFREPVAAGLKDAGCPIPQEKWFTNLSSKGNTGSASIYIIMEELFNSGRLRPGEKLLCFIPESGRFSTAFMHLTVV
ncbi:MAG: hypothetical protein DRH03_09695 [Deltaproteobacteria bacterium]|nr:MAG: hypothetical protein DRH03_09695 [Deltaproteobacteria bacterium]